MNALPPLPFERLGLIDDPTPRDAALNMALDEALLDRLGEDPLLRIYRWAKPSVSIGCFEPHEPVCRQWPERDWVRRWTGGGIVEHGDDLTFSLLIPRSMPLASLGAEESYRAIHAAVALAWTSSDPHPGGVLFAEAAGAKTGSHACFDNPVRHDLILDGHKIAGGAQRRTQRGILHQGSVQGASASLSALARELPPAFGRSVSRRDMTNVELDAARMLTDMKYAAPAWRQRF